MPKKLRILYCITKGNWGGAQKYVFELASHIPQDQFDPIVVHGEGTILPAKLREKHIPTIFIDSLGRDINPLADIASFFSLLKLFFKEKPNIVHLNSSKIGGLGAVAARLAGIKKIIFTVHGFAFNEDRPWYQKKLIEFVSWLSVVFCTHIIFISKTERDQTKNWMFIEKKSSVIYNGISIPTYLERIQAQKFFLEKINRPLSFFTPKKVIGSIGELVANKGYVYALQALKELQDKNYIYLIIGTGDQEKQLRDYIKNNNLKETVFLIGFVKDAAQYLKALDIFLLTSVKEGMPYVLLEAAFAHVPIIATDVGGIREMNISSLIKPKDGSEISHALLQEHTPQEVANLERFTLESMISQTSQIYHG
jgi:glycosyltransferase involved in cell wall biosynthesis